MPVARAKKELNVIVCQATATCCCPGLMLCSLVLLSPLALCSFPIAPTPTFVQSVVKSAASGIEQQLNALKGILGFD